MAMDTARALNKSVLMPVRSQLHSIKALHGASLRRILRSLCVWSVIIIRFFFGKKLYLAVTDWLTYAAFIPISEY